MRRYLAICGGGVLLGLIALLAWPFARHALFVWRAGPMVGGSIEGDRAGELRTDNLLRMAFIWIPPGRFKMGSPPGEKKRYKNETQVDTTIAHGFWLGRYEVTQAQWQEVIGSSPWFWGRGSDYPATYVSWDDATRFCESLTEREQKSGRLPAGWEYTLPTEAQWEYACRAGSSTAYCFGDDESQLGRYAWYDDNTSKANERYAHRVGQKEPNAWGLYDMHGNVLEWCRDEGPIVTETDVRLKPIYGAPRLMLGGSWFHGAEGCRSAFRTSNWKHDRAAYLGFRVALVQSAK